MCVYVTHFFLSKNNLSWLGLLQYNYFWSRCGKMVKAIKVKGQTVAVSGNTKYIKRAKYI